MKSPTGSRQAPSYQTSHRQLIHRLPNYKQAIWKDPSVTSNDVRRGMFLIANGAQWVSGDRRFSACDDMMADLKKKEEKANTKTMANLPLGTKSEGGK